MVVCDGGNGPPPEEGNFMDIITGLLETILGLVGGLLGGLL
ncbi:hypothetical protein [Microbacterium sp.]|nr:hypothetical protein CZ774_01640 [Frigoribacterium sp. JB110]